MPWFTQSNALARLQNNPPACFLSLRAHKISLTFSYILENAVSNEIGL
jgi:hypothetical protein